MAGIEEEIDSRLPYRIGCPTLPVLPVETRTAPQAVATYIPNFNHHVGNIRDILTAYNIEEYGISFVYRVNPGIVPTDRHLTLLLESWYEDGCQDQWVKAVAEIRRSLIPSGIYWAIELIDIRALHRWPHIGPILSTDRDVIEGWSKVLPDFFTTIENRNWVSIDVLHREFPGQSLKRPTVIISARDANDVTWWDTTIPALHQLLQANNFKIDISLLYQEGINLLWNEDSANSIILRDAYEYIIYMGSSCAPLKSKGSGTLGGRIKLQGPSSVLELGLTNYHVLEEALPEQPIPFAPVSDQSYGIAVTPSDNDHNAVVKAMQDYKKDLEKKLGQVSENFEYLTEDDPSWENKRDLIQELGIRISSEDSGIRRRKNFPRHIGNIYAASGYRACRTQRYFAEESDHWALDWCLIRVDKSKSISCELQDVPEIPPEIPPPENQPGNAVLGSIENKTEAPPKPQYYLRNGDEVANYCSISAQKNYQVAKRGRTTGWTRGTISAIDSVVRTQDSGKPITKLSTIQKEFLQGRFGGKEVFVHTITGTAKAPQFLEPGDSGSFILLNEDSTHRGSIVGLGFAANDVSSVSYMMPMDLIVQDIEYVTGGKVIDPQNAGEAVPVPDK
ncbi:hypothetical protein K505DRAFT_365686 [Melanomma pulvis-pyrius CBS 109.77]|uniref:Uncharacterized protein n=1 Tax=Melanomma pulvis-pyrius CBS 109.77 TaxID=1314802 RepID=A0A6A6WZG8_9PLEO|nr:hypothetical protein K505DRAFT_365686 [Melanomma pulvis-pyrius CBS 109.77]